MVYKKYVYKRGRRHGPYYYKSYREGESIKKIYIGGEEEYKEWLEKQKERASKSPVEQPRALILNSDWQRKDYGKILFLISLACLIFFISVNLAGFLNAHGSFTSFAVSENISASPNLLYGEYKNEEVVGKFNTKTTELEIKEPVKFEGEALSRNKNKRMYFNLNREGLVLYFDLLNYSEFVENVGELSGKEKAGIKETKEGELYKTPEETAGKINATAPTAQEINAASPENITETNATTENATEVSITIPENTTEKTPEEANATLPQETNTPETPVNETQEQLAAEQPKEEPIAEKPEEEQKTEPVVEKPEETPVTGAAIRGFFMITGKIIQNIKSITARVIGLGNETEQEIVSNETGAAETRVQTASNETSENQSNEASQSQESQKSAGSVVLENVQNIQEKVSGLNEAQIEQIAEASEIKAENFDIAVNEPKLQEKKEYKWEYRVKLNDLNFLAKIEVTSSQSISVWNENTLKIGNALLSFSDLAKAGYTIRFEKPALEIQAQPEITQISEQATPSVTGSFIRGFTGMLISAIGGITGKVVNEHANEINDLEYKNSISVYIERDFSNNTEGIKVGDMLSLDPTLIIIEISKAQHLDAERNFISDIYESVKALDGNWSESINNNEYVRVTFEKNLTNKNDITFYGRSTNETSEIEVYRENNNSLTARFENVSEAGWHKVYLSSLAEGESYDVFDLKVLGSVEFDYIVDPFADNGSLAQNIDDCGILNTTNAVYTLNASITGGYGSSAPCIMIQANNITLDMNNKFLKCGSYYCGYCRNSECSDYDSCVSCEGGCCNEWVEQDCITNGISINGYNSSTIKNGNITNCSTAIEISRAANSTITGNLISYNGIGIGSESSLTYSANTIINNTFNYNSVWGIVTGANSSIINNTISHSYLGINLYESSNNIIKGNTINYGTNGIGCSGGSNITITDNIIHSNTKSGIFFINGASNSILARNTIYNNTGTYGPADNDAYGGIWLHGAYHSVVRDSNLSGNTWDVILTNGALNNTFLNCSYDISKENVTQNTVAPVSLIRKWYYRAYVNDTLGNLVSGANVTAFNVSGNYNFNLTSDATGYTQLGEIIDYVNNGSARSYYSNYTIYAGKSGYLTGNHTYNSTLSQNNYKDVFMLTAVSDSEYPVFSNYKDNNASLFNSGTGWFNVTLTSTNGTVILEINNTNITATNLTASVYNASYSFDSSGVYTYYWHSWGNGTSHLYNKSDDRSYSILSDTTAPNISIVSPENRTYTTTTIDFNVTAVDNIRIESCWYSLTNGATNYTMSNTTASAWNATNSTMAQGSQTARFYCNDSAGNLNNSESVSFAIDTITPILTIISPLITQTTSTTLFNVSANEALSWCGMSLDNSTNITMTLNSSSTGAGYINSTMKDGGHTAVFSCNDTAGNLNSSSVTFTSDTLSVTICRTLAQANTVYNLNQSLTILGNNICIIISANNITLDMNGYNITGTTEEWCDCGDPPWNNQGDCEANECVWFHDPTLIYSPYSYSNIKNGFLYGDGRGTGISLYNAYNSTTNNMSAGNLSYGWAIDGGSHHILLNSTIYSSTQGVRTQGSATDIQVSNCNINNNYDGIYLYTSSSNILKDSNLSGNSNKDVDVEGNNNTFLNCSYDISKEFIFNGELIRKWYYRTYVNDSLGNNVSNANVTAYNVSNAYNFNLTTGSDGYTAQTEIIDYVNYNGIRTYHSLYNMTAVNSSYTPSLISHELNASLGNNYKDVFTFIIDTTNPLISFGTNTADDYANLSQSWIYANVTWLEDNFANITFSLYNDSGAVNSTNYITPVYTINWTGLTDNNYTYEVNITDTSNNENSTGIRHITLDTISPTINFTSPAESNGSYASRRYILVNVTSADLNLKNITISLYNSTSLINSTATSFSPNYQNISVSYDGAFYINATAYDYAENSNSTETRSIIIDTENPVLSSVSSSVTTDSSAITWATNENANSSINYGTTGSLGSFANDSSFITSHSIALSGLSSSTTYYYNITSCDRAGNCVTNGTYSFTTSAPAPPVTGPGGGGGITPREENLVISPKILNVPIVINTVKTKEIELYNNGTASVTANLKVEGLENILLLEDKAVSLASGERKKINIRVIAPEEPGIYTGKILINRQEVLVSVSVSTKELLFDVEIIVPDAFKKISVGDKLPSETNVIRRGDYARLDVKLDYTIRDFNGNILLKESKTILVEGNASLSQVFSTQNLPVGDYILGVELSYPWPEPEGVAVSTYNFEIREKPEKPKPAMNTILLISLIGGILILILLILIVARHRKIKKHKVRKKRQ